jgi:hypothetical protein
VKREKLKGSRPHVSNRETRNHGRGQMTSTCRKALTININDQCAIDAGSWQECVEV